MAILLKNIHIVNESYSNQPLNIVIEDEFITEIGPSATTLSPDITIDGTNRHLYVTSALFNSHTHLPMTLLRGFSDDLPLALWLQKIWSLEKHFTKETCKIGAELAFLEMIKSGCGGFADFYFNEDAILPSAIQSGLRGILGAGIIEGAFLEQGGADWMLKEAGQLAQKTDNEPLIQTAIAPHAPHTCSEETLQKCLDFADKYRTPLTIHVSETREDVINMQKTTGFPPIEWLDQNFSFFTDRNVHTIHCVWIQQKEIEILAKHNASVAFCPVSGQKLAYGGLAPVPELLNSGVNVSLGTDGTASNNTLDMVREMRAGATLISHNRWDPSLVSSVQILNMATKAFRKKFFHMGSIEVGNIADLTIFDLSTPHTRPIHNPISTLVYSANGSNTHSLIVNGKFLMKNKVLLTLNEEEILKKADSERISLENRAKEAS